ncbi:MAG: hypothetical protein ABJZ55_07250 [Fuerstiella sp.]
MQDSGVIEFESHTHTHEGFRDRPQVFPENLQHSIDWLHHQYGICQPSLSLLYGIVEREVAGPAFYETARSLGCTCRLAEGSKQAEGCLDKPLKSAAAS